MNAAASAISGKCRWSIEARARGNRPGENAAWAREAAWTGSGAMIGSFAAGGGLIVAGGGALTAGAAWAALRREPYLLA